MAAQQIGPHHERGYYIVWDTANWRKERVRRHMPFLPTSLSLLEHFADSFAAGVDGELWGSVQQPGRPAPEHRSLKKGSTNSTAGEVLREDAAEGEIVFFVRVWTGRL